MRMLALALFLLGACASRHACTAGDGAAAEVKDVWTEDPYIYASPENVFVALLLTPVAAVSGAIRGAVNDCRGEPITVWTQPEPPSPLIIRTGRNFAH